ncbi:MAG TPA: hypothetical protein VMD53_18005 [Rhizomicrobium sp.]|nr:hypothetical protein [Rhizomicrobium sp.]
MADSGSRVSAACALSAAMIAACLLLMPANSSAQTDQTVVMTCLYQNGSVRTLTLDLARKTGTSAVYWDARPELGHTDPLTTTQMTDQDVTFAVQGATYTLSRFTGDLTESWNGGGTVHCRKQQKQF